MGWIKISDEDGGVYAKEPDNDPEQIVSVAELEAEIAELQERIKDAEANLIPIPDKADDRVAEAINDKNGFLVGEKILFDGWLAEKQQLLKSLLEL